VSPNSLIDGSVNRKYGMGADLPGNFKESFRFFSVAIDTHDSEALVGRWGPLKKTT
jgi:hypothetical protein